MSEVNKRINDFKLRLETERDYCESLFHHATIRLLAAKYSYYIQSDKMLDDSAYDNEEKSWYVMAMALNAIKSDETSPCIGWDEKHPLANEAILYYNKIMGGKK